jgi:hypothetical protein
MKSSPVIAQRRRTRRIKIIPDLAYFELPVTLRECAADFWAEKDRNAVPGFVEPWMIEGGDR